LFDGENISYDATVVIYKNSTNIPPIMLIKGIYEHQNFLSLQLVSFLVGLRTYQHPCKCQKSRTECLRQKHALIWLKACKENLNNQQKTYTQQTLAWGTSRRTQCQWYSAFYATRSFTNVLTRLRHWV